MPPGNTHEATRRIVLREPYAGNRHVRFDESWKQTIIGFVHQIVDALPTLLNEYALVSHTFELSRSIERIEVACCQYE